MSAEISPLAPTRPQLRSRPRPAERTDAVGRMLGWLRRVLGYVSMLGWTVLALGLVLWYVAHRFGWTEMAMAATAALVLFVLCVALALGRTRVQISVEVNPHRVTVGERAAGKVAVLNKARGVLLPLLVELPVGISAARFTLPPLRRGKTHDELFVVPTHRRGVIPVGPATTVQGDPLGLVRRTLRWTGTTELFVHPRTVALESVGSGLLRDLEGDVTEDLSRSDLAFHALREYQPGDDRHYIHWRSSAKAGRLLVRQFLDTRRSHLSVIIDTDPASYRDTGTTGHPGEDVVGDVELAISVGASLARRSLLDEQGTTVLCHEQSVHRGTVQIMLDAMARATLGPVDLPAAAIEVLRLAAETSAVFVVSGPRRRFIDLQRCTGQFDSAVRTVVIIVDASRKATIQHAGGLTMLTIGQLGELTGLLRAALNR